MPHRLVSLLRVVPFTACLIAGASCARGAVSPDPESAIDAVDVVDGGMQGATDADGGDDPHGAADAGAPARNGGGANADAGGSDDTADGTDGGASGVDGGRHEEDAGPDTVEPWQSTHALLPATARCLPAQDACGRIAPVPVAPAATYRTDRFLPGTTYVEPFPLPESGGRMHVAATAAVTGRWTRLLINGRPADELETQDGKLHWHHVWPHALVAGAPMWVAFHTADAAFDVPGATVDVVVETDAGVALSARLPVVRARAPLSAFSTTADLDTDIIHVRNDDVVPHRIARVLVDGDDVTSSGAVCLARPVVAPGATTLLTVPRCAPRQPGDAWTVVVEFEDAPASVAVGRVVPSFFPVEGWPDRDDCPFPVPGGKPDMYQSHRGAFFDTLYMYWSGSKEGGCDFHGRDVMNTAALDQTGLKVLVADDFAKDAQLSELVRTDHVAAFATGDESDGDKYLPNGRAQAGYKASLARRLWDAFPEVPVYNGGYTHRQIGAFAGAVDVQGLDFYVAACAPHITPWGSNPPLRAPYDYLRNMRENHDPLPTWMYTQGFHDGWNKQTQLGFRAFQPDPHELTVQAMMTVAAGGKGIMWFQTDHEEVERVPARWVAVKNINRTIGAVRELLREGAAVDGATTSASEDDVIVAALRSPEAIVVPVITLFVEEAVTDTRCGLAQTVGVPQPPHWRIGSQMLDVTVALPADVGIDDVFAVEDGAVVPVVATLDAGQRTLTIRDVGLDEQRPVRLFVLASAPDVRARVAAAGAQAAP